MDFRSIMNMPAGSRVSAIQQKYDLTKFGFLPDAPLQPLPEKYKMWEELAKDLPRLNKEKLTRKVVDELPVIGCEDLKQPEQYKRAYSILSMICNSYVWCDHQNKNNVDYVPEQISKPLWHVCGWLGINPILTHASVDIYNWMYIDPTKGPQLDNLKSVFTVTGTDDEQWFYLIMVAIEAIGGRTLEKIIECWTLDEPNGYAAQGAIVGLVLGIIEDVKEMCKIVRRMKERCKPEAFWNDLRPFLSGWKNNDDLPNGLVYKGVSSEGAAEERYKYLGGSAAQSSLFQILDAFIGIKHEDGYFVEIRDYMPKKHKEFIEFAEQQPTIYNCMSSTQSSEELIDRLVKELKKFRQLHYGLVHNYILKMINPKSKDEESSDESEDEDDEDSPKGTGGTTLKKFLKGAIKDTADVIKENQLVPE